MKTYKKLSPLGAGRNSEVWLALRSGGEPVAVKFFRDAAAARDEFECGASLTHPCLLHPDSLTEEDGRMAMSMPYCEGRSADNLTGYLDEKSAWQLLRDVASALDYMHGKNLCHGDVTPSNIFWDGTSFILADFGSCASGCAGYEDSVAYSAPEKRRTAGSDIWSLGATVFCLVLGTRVWGGLGGGAQHPDSPVPYLRRSMPELSALVRRCLAFHPQDRPSAKEIAGIASKEYDACVSAAAERPLRERYGEAPSLSADFWPDQMIQD